jgi:hypothetical protein
MVIYARLSKPGICVVIGRSWLERVEAEDHISLEGEVCGQVLARPRIPFLSSELSLPPFLLYTTKPKTMSWLARQTTSPALPSRVGGVDVAEMLWALSPPLKEQFETT